LYQQVSFPPWYFVRAPGQYQDIFGTASATPAATNVEVVSFTVPDNCLGLLLGVAFEGGQLTNWWWGTWTLFVGDAPHPYLNNVQGMVSRITSPISVWSVLKPGQRVRILVSNGNNVETFTYGGRLFLYTQEKSIPLGPGVSGADMELRS